MDKPRRANLLSELPGVGTKLADRIANYYRKSYQLHRLLGRNYDEIPFVMVGKELHDEAVLDAIKRDPYKLTNVPGIGFKKADTIALEQGWVEKDDPKRVVAGNEYVLRQGGGVMPIWKYHKARDTLGLHKAMATLNVKYDMGYVWLYSEYDAEVALADFLRGYNPEFTPSPLVANAGTLNDDQSLAIQTALGMYKAPGKQVMALTGGAGTGKTHTIAELVAQANMSGLQVSVVAFAGKATVRVKEALRKAHAEAYVVSTIHKAAYKEFYSQDEDNDTPLHLIPDEKRRAFQADIVIVDEASMLPNELMFWLLQHCDNLVLVGDPNQLPPIGYGTPFSDFLDSHIPHVHLDQNYRTADMESLFDFGQAILNDSPVPPTKHPISIRDSFNFDDAFTDLSDVVEALAAGDDSWQVITFKNVDRHFINRQIQSWLNPNGQPLFSYRVWDANQDQVVRVGDKVVVTTNTSTSGVFNGEVGYVSGYHVEGQVIVELPDRTALLEQTEAEGILQLGYCITTHKAQGSDWEHIVLYQPDAVKFTSKRWWYTASTRAKLSLTLFTGMSTTQMWINATATEPKRTSTLMKRVVK